MVDSVAQRWLEGALTTLRRMAQGKMRKAADERFVDAIIESESYDSVKDADSNVSDRDARTRRDHFASGQVEPIEAGAEVLTVAQMRTMAGVKARNSRYW